MNASVTRQHRELSFASIWSDRPRPNEQRWIETGEPGAGERCERTAQAMANLEARMAHKAWAEGYNAGAADWGQGGPDNDVPAPNPYPELEP